MLRAFPRCISVGDIGLDTRSLGQESAVLREWAITAGVLDLLLKKSVWPLVHMSVSMYSLSLLSFAMG